MIVHSLPFASFEILPILSVLFDGPDPVVGGGVSVAGVALIGILALAADRDLGVSELTDRVERLLDGEHDVAFPTDRNDEMGRLATALEDVAEELRRRETEVTERREHRRALERYREYTDDVLNALDDVFYVIDEKGALLRWNQVFADVTGYEDDEIDRMDALEFFPEDEHERIETAIDAVFETGEGRVESELLTEDGKRIPYEFVARRLTDPDGEPVLTGIGRDITDRKERERTLRERERMLSTLMDNVPGMVYRGRNEWNWPFEFVSDGCRTVTGYDPEPIERGTVDWAEEVILDNNDDIWAAVQTAIEHEEPFRLTYRIETADGDVRWVWEQGRGVFDDDGELAAIEGVIFDITERKEYELALESLQETTRTLLGTDTPREAAQLVVERAADFLDVEGIAVYLLDDETNRLEPTAVDDGFVELCESPEAVSSEDDSVLWEAFVEGDRTVVDTQPSRDSSGLCPAVEGGLVVPMGDSGVFVVASPSASIDDDTRRLVGMLAATTEAALDRLESETLLRERERELERRNRRLRRQVQINDIIRSIHRTLVGSDSRSDIERAVCERLVEAEDVAFAWIGTVDANGTTIEPRTWAGDGQGYLDELSFVVPDGSEPATVTARTDEPTVVENVVEGLGTEAWRQRALRRDFHSVVSVPLLFDEFSAGVLTVYADEPGVFGTLERTVFAELGESIAESITAVNTQQALHADTLVELTIRLAGGSFFTRLARETDCEIEYEGIASRNGATSRLFFTSNCPDSEGVLAALEEFVSVRDARLVNDLDDGALFEVTVTEETVPVRLARHGGRVRSIRAAENDCEVVVEVPTTTSVREFVGMLEEEYDEVELLGRRDVERPIQTRQAFLEYLLEGLTDRQLEVLRTAYYAGFFEWPRASTGEEIAAMLEVSQPTVNRHLRRSQQRLLEGLLDDRGANDL